MTPLKGNNIIQQKFMLIENDNQHTQPDMLLLLVLNFILKAHLKKRHISQAASSTQHVIYNPYLPFIPKNITRRWITATYILVIAMFMTWNEHIVTNSHRKNKIGLY